MKTPKLVSLTKNEGGSGRGLSYYQEASFNPRWANLSDDYNTKVRNGELPPPAVKNHFSLGSALHKLMELWISPPPEGYVLDQHELEFNENAKEAVRLFKAYQSKFTINHFGKLEACEFKLPFTDAAKQTVAEDFFGLKLTGKPDAVYYTTDSDIARLNNQHGLHLPKTGYYLVDWKTSSYDRDDEYYSEGGQQILYPYLWNLEFPEKPIIGTIYQIIITNQKKKDKTPTFQTVYAPYDSARLAYLKGMLAMAKFGVAFDLPNFACAVDKFTGELGFFIRNGMDNRLVSPENEIKLKKVFEFIANLK